MKSPGTPGLFFFGHSEKDRLQNRRGVGE